MKDGTIFWFKTDNIVEKSVTRGRIEISQCLAVKGAEEAINKPFAFEITTKEKSALAFLPADKTMYFVADNEKDKEDWINSIGRAIVRRSTSMQDHEVLSY